MGQLIVAGFHRSGTSLLTQLLHSAGLFVGDELLGAMPSNPYGHFEDREVLELHRAVLNRHGDDWQWDEPFAFHIGADHWETMRRFVAKRDREHATWGFKDPRVCLFMGAWKYLMPDAKAIIVYRDPGECVRSMESRQSSEYFSGKGDAKRHLRFFTEPDHGLKLWDSHNRALVAYAEAHLDECLVLPFTALTGQYPVVARLNERLGFDLRPVDTGEVFDPDVTSSRVAPQRVIDPAVGRRVDETWAALESLAERTAL
jgi:hypothetical protein